MTAVPSGSTPVWVTSADGAGDEEVNVLSLAGQPAPDGGAWLRVTAAGPEPGGELAGLFLGNRPVACGGDVLVHLRLREEQHPRRGSGTGRGGGGTGATRQQRTAWG